MLKSRINDYKPDLVFLVFCTNDPGDNLKNMTWGDYFKPYFDDSSGKLVLKGVPVPKSLSYYYSEHRWLFKSYIVRAIATIYTRYTNATHHVNIKNPTKSLLLAFKKLVNENGAKFSIGFIEGNSELQQFSTNNGIPNLALISEHKIPPKVGHWSQTGQIEISNQIFDFFKKTELLQDNNHR